MRQALQLSSAEHRIQPTTATCELVHRVDLCISVASVRSSLASCFHPHSLLILPADPSNEPSFYRHITHPSIPSNTPAAPKHWIWSTRQRPTTTSGGPTTRSSIPPTLMVCPSLPDRDSRSSPECSSFFTLTHVPTPVLFTFHEIYMFTLPTRHHRLRAASHTKRYLSPPSATALLPQRASEAVGGITLKTTS